MGDTDSRRRRVHYNPAASAFEHDPFPSLRQLREADPVHLTPQGWVLTRYDDCAEVLASRSFGMRGIEGMLRKQVGPGPALEVIASRFHSYDPPEHTRLRAPVARAFTARRVEDMRGHIRGHAERLLDAVGKEEAFDVVDKLAHPLASTVIAEMLGTPPDERAQLNAWTERILTLQGMRRPEKRTLEDGNRAAEDFLAYARAFIEARRSTRGPDLVTSLIAAEEEGQRLTAEEVARSIVFLSNAGFTTTRNLIASAVVALLGDRRQWELLVREPALIGEAVAEALRYDCSLTTTPRFAREDAIVGNRRVAARAAVFCSLNAANRDPQRFPDPDRFDLMRSDKKHLAFGGGVHSCLGARLARLQIEVALSALLERFPNLQLSPGRIEWHSGLYRGPTRVRVLTGNG